MGGLHYLKTHEIQNWYLLLGIISQCFLYREAPYSIKKKSRKQNVKVSISWNREISTKLEMIEISSFPQPPLVIPGPKGIQEMVCSSYNVNEKRPHIEFFYSFLLFTFTPLSSPRDLWLFFQVLILQPYPHLFFFQHLIFLFQSQPTMMRIIFYFRSDLEAKNFYII